LVHQEDCWLFILFAIKKQGLARDLASGGQSLFSQGHQGKWRKAALPGL